MARDAAPGAGRRAPGAGLCKHARSRRSPHSLRCSRSLRTTACTVIIKLHFCLLLFVPLYIFIVKAHYRVLACGSPDVGGVVVSAWERGTQPCAGRRARVRALFRAFSPWKCSFAPAGGTGTVKVKRDTRRATPVPDEVGGIWRPPSGGPGRAPWKALVRGAAARTH